MQSQAPPDESGADPVTHHEDLMPSQNGLGCSRLMVLSGYCPETEAGVNVRCSKWALLCSKRQRRPLLWPFSRFALPDGDVSESAGCL